jgi:hypothetical protein
MTLHYHAADVNPVANLLALAGAHFCVSHYYPTPVRLAHEIGQSVMLDNGAFSAWRKGEPVGDWTAYYEWVDRWLDYPTTWAVIPDVIDGDEGDNSRLCRAWPFRDRGAPVWHMHESLNRLVALIHSFPRVCIGSSGAFAVIMSDRWSRRMDEAWRTIDCVFKRTPNVHMLRGMSLIRERWPFASVDSSDIARNHNRNQNTPAKMRARWDAGQCPARFHDPGEQAELVA